MPTTAELIALKMLLQDVHNEMETHDHEVNGRHLQCEINYDKCEEAQEIVDGWIAEADHV